MHKEIIQQFKRERKRLKMTQLEVSEIAEVSHFTVSRMESGATIPPLNIFLKCADAVGMMVALVPKPIELRREKREKNKRVPTIKRKDIDWDAFIKD